MTTPTGPHTGHPNPPTPGPAAPPVDSAGPAGAGTTRPGTPGSFDSSTGRSAALTRWAMEPDPAAATAKARRGFLARFENQVDPDRVLTEEEREVRAQRLMRAHMTNLAKKRRRRGNLRSV